MKTTKNLMNEITDNLAPFMLKNAGIEELFVVGEIRKSFSEKVSASIVFDGKFNDMDVKLVELSTGDGVVWVNGERSNLDNFNLESTKKELGV